MLDTPGNVESPRNGIVRNAAEALLVALAGIVLALAANAISPRGLSLTTKNLLPAGVNPPNVRPTPGTNTVGSSNSIPPTNALEVSVRAEGMRVLDLAGAEKLFGDPRRQDYLVIFIDARNDDDFTQGHIPGAFHFSPYHVEKYIADVMPPCQIAQQIIVYCTGGECEDSHSAALDLRDAGIPADKLYIFAGGITEWESAKQPVEAGPRNSGDIHTPAP